MKTDSTPTVLIMLEKRVTLKSNKGKHPVKLRVTYQRESHYYTLKDDKKNSIALSESDFQRIVKGSNLDDKKSVRLSQDEKDLHLQINSRESKALEVIESLPVFTWEGFEEKYFGKKGHSDVVSLLRSRADNLRKEGRTGTAVSIECVAASLEKYLKEKDLKEKTLPIAQLTVKFLKSYESWMLKKGNSLTTTGIYLRNVRTVYREAMTSGIIKTGMPYPFGKKGYQIPTGTNTKKALSQSEVGMIANYSARPGSAEEKYRDYWMFSYLCNGINIKDIALLKYGNIHGEIISLIRAKTQLETRKSPKPIEIVITRQIGRIIDRWGNKPARPDRYIFPILEPGMTADHQYKRIQDVTARINKAMRSIAEAVEINKKVTTYVARHSFATVLKRSGASTEFISESLGHKNLQTTENYLDNFEIDEKRKWAEILTNYEKEN